MKFTDYCSGEKKQQYDYFSFQPNLVNIQWQWDDPEIDVLLAEANRRLGELNGLSLIVPDLDRFIQMHVVKEAQASSRIEGTRTEMDEALQHDPEEIDPEKRDDWREVRNYIEAMNDAIEELVELPLSNRLLCSAHHKLLQGARGERKTPGEFRRSQNWIGGASLADAVFIPPHHEDIAELLSDMEAFWHNESLRVPQLIRIAISHYQFETIHPFLDGNGRVGRLLITLYLVSKNLLQHPCLYLSAHLEKHRDQYYDALMRVRQSHDIGHWVRFFLVAVIETSKQATETFAQILQVREKTSKTLSDLGRASVNATRIVEYLYEKPVVSSAELSKKLSLSGSTVIRLLALLKEEGIIEELTGKKRNRVYYFKEYYQLFL